MLGLLTGGITKYLIIGLVIAAMGGWIMIQRANLKAATIERDQAVAAAAASEARFDALQVDIERVDAAAGRAQAARDQLEADLAETRRAINDAPVTTACVDSPGVRAALDWLRSRDGPAAAGGPPRRPAPLVPDVVP